MSKNEEGDSVSIRSYLLNKKERYEYELKTTGQDGRLKEIEAKIELIKNSKDLMYERRKRIEGFDFIYAEGRMAELLDEIFSSYILGNYYATIAVASMTAERLCYDFIDLLDIRIGQMMLTDTQKEELSFLPFSRMISFLLKIGILDDDSKTLLYQINDIRNRHIHPKMKDGEKDALEIVNLLCHVLESRLSMFRFYNLVEGKFIRKCVPKH